MFSSCEMNLIITHFARFGLKGQIFVMAIESNHDKIAPKLLRTDIQFLRAVSVVMVVFFHLNWISGGFIGVDSFFVVCSFWMF
jgi:hypothetical protein